MSDIGCQDLFYENLTLGVVRVLEEIPGVRNVAVIKSTPVERSVLSSWEQRYGVLLPADLRRFYLAVDGFSLSWDYEYAGRLLPAVGRMHVNPVADLRRLTASSDTGSSLNESMPTAAPIPAALQLPPPLPRCPDSADEHVNVSAPVKAFELDSCRGAAKICLVANKVWLLDRAFEWHLLAKDFTCYFRIMLVHLGLPLWQFRFTSMGMTPWAEQLASLVAPHLLLQNTNVPVSVPSTPAPSSTSISAQGVPAYAQLDPSVFKSAPRVRNKSKDQ